VNKVRIPFLSFVTAAALLALALFALSACEGSQALAQDSVVPNGDPERGRQALRTTGCGTCHTIPGVLDANATVGPPLDDWADRVYIAGLLDNTPTNLIQWIRSPQTFEPGTAMPDIGISEQDARDMAAYLYTLRRSPNRE
jgi:cytochrome c2